MKNKNMGFIGITLLIVAALVILGGGAYIAVSHHEKVKEQIAASSTVATYSSSTVSASLSASTSVSVGANVDLSDQAVVNALNHDSSTSFTLQKNAMGNSGYQYNIPGGGALFINKIYKGDLNGDGYSDALITEGFCGASCGQGLEVVINQKDGTGKGIDVKAPDTIQGSGVGQTSLNDIKIENGLIYITANNFYASEEDYNTNPLPAQTKKFQLQGDALVEVK
jgi:hypothetical protein